MPRCPACSADNPEGTRFCEDCGNALAANCPQCGAAVHPGKRFCGGCGYQLAATAPPAPHIPPSAPPPTPAAERRICSVLFADLVGFTPLSEARDPEAVRELLSGYFDVARTVISRYGGVVEKFIGDAVMAVWGVPTAHEDDAERCVRAALELVDAVTGYGESHHAPGLAARAGVVTGEVAVTLGASGEGMVAGDAVNTAARVQAAAEPGGVLVDDATRAASSRGIAFTDAGAQQLKGKAAPVRLWRATRLLASVGGADRVDGLEASFLGRDRELRQVKELFHACAQDRRARLVSVTGVAGVGKSRLGWEFFKYVDGLADTVLWHSGRCLSYGDGIAYWALAEMVRQRFGIPEEQGGAAAEAKLTAGLDRWIGDPAERDFLGPRLRALLGVGDVTLGKEELFAGWRLFFERLSDESPVVLAFEDLHWADAGLLDFIEHLLDWSAEFPIFLLGFARPDLLDRRPGWAAARRNASPLPLDPLTAPVMHRLLDELVPGLPAEVAGRIVGQADGIPLYAVETVRRLIDRDLVQPIDGVYRLVRPVENLDVPASLSSLIAARIDALPIEQRALVQDLAVLGTTFPRAAVAAVSQLPDGELDRLLADLVRREILAVRADRLSPDRGQYTFTQGLLRQVGYDTLSRRDRKSRHLAVAAHLRATFPDDGAEVAETVARHYRDALDAVPDDPDAGELRGQAVTAYTRAARRAVGVGAPEAALSAYRAAAELADAEEQRAELTGLAGRAAFQAGRADAAVELLKTAGAAHITAGRRRDAARLYSEAAHALGLTGQRTEAESLAREALGLVDTGQPDEVTAVVAGRLGRLLALHGEPQAVPFIETAFVYAQALQLPEVLCTAFHARAFLLSAQGRHQEALVCYRAAAELGEQHGLTREAETGHGNAGYLLMAGDLPGAEGELRRALELSHRRGDRRGEATNLGNLANVDLFAGRWEAVARLATEALAETGRQGEFLQVRLVELCARRGDLQAARRHLDGLTRWRDVDDTESQAVYAAAAATVAAAEAAWDDALRSAETAVSKGIHLDDLRSEAVRQAWPEAMEAALASRRLADADRLLALIADRLPGHVPPYLAAQLARFRARLSAARGEHDTVEADFERAEAQLAELGYPYWLARTQLDHAEWLRGQHRGAEAEVLLAEAAAVFERLGARPDLQRARPQRVSG